MPFLYGPRPTGSERLADGENGPSLAVVGVCTPCDVDVGVGVGEREVDGEGGHGDAELPVPVVVVGNAVEGVLLDVLAADGAEQLERQIVVHLDEVERHGGQQLLVPGDAGGAEEVGAVVQAGGQLDDVEVVADEEAVLAEIEAGVVGAAGIVVAHEAGVEDELVAERLEADAADGIDLDGRTGAGEVDVAAPGLEVGGEGNGGAEGGGLVAEAGLAGDAALGLREAAIRIVRGDGKVGVESATKRTSSDGLVLGLGR